MHGKPAQKLEKVVTLKMKTNSEQHTDSVMELTCEWPEKVVYKLLTLSDVSSLTPGYVLEELLKHPVCLF